MEMSNTWNSKIVTNSKVELVRNRRMDRQIKPIAKVVDDNKYIALPLVGYYL